MTVYLETDFLFALAKDTDWLQESAEAALDEYEVSRGSLEPTDTEEEVNRDVRLLDGNATVPQMQLGSRLAWSSLRSCWSLRDLTSEYTVFSKFIRLLL